MKICTVFPSKLTPTPLALSISLTMLLLAGTFNVSAALLWSEPFPTSYGNNVSLGSGGSATAWAGGNSVSTGAGCWISTNQSPALTYSGIAKTTGSAGDYAAFLTGSTSGNRAKSAALTTSVTLTAGAKVYCSFLINVQTTPSANKLIAYLRSDNASTVTPTGLGIWLDSNLKLGIAKATTSSGNVTFNTGGTALSLNTTYLVVARYTYNNGNSTADIVDLWQNPGSLGVAEASVPTPATVTRTATGGSQNALIAYFGLDSIKSGSDGAATGDILVDDIRVGNTWADVTPSGCTAPTSGLSFTASLNPDCSGANTVLSLAGTQSGANYSYQLYAGGSPVAGTSQAGTGGTLTWTVAPTTATTYSVYCTGDGTTVCTGPTKVDASDVAVTIATATAGGTSSTANGTVAPGSSVTISLSGQTGAGTLTYQWYKDGTQLTTDSHYTSGVTGSSLVINPVSSADTTSGAGYVCHVTGSCGTASSTGTQLTVNCTTAGVTGNANQSVSVGNTATFTATGVTGTSPTYQWQVNKGSGFVNVDVGGADGTGGTTASFTTVATTSAMNGYHYQCLVSVSCDSSTATSPSALLTVTCTSASINTSPSNETVASGSVPAAFTVSASGSALTYQWQVNKGSGFVNVDAGGADGTGGTTASFTPVSATSGMNGYQYQCVVTAGCGSPATSGAATLLVMSPGNTYFRSQATGNWSATSTWQWSQDNSTWYSAATTPTSANCLSVTVVSPNSVTVNANVAVPATTIAAGSVVTVSGATMTIGSGLVDVSGALNLAGTNVAGGTLSVISGSTTGTLVFENGSTNSVQLMGATFPTATWNANSNARYEPSTNTVPGSAAGATIPAGLGGQTFGNFIWNWSAQNNSIMLNNTLTNMAGNFEYNGGQSACFSVKPDSNSVAATVTIGGTVRIHNVNGHNFLLTSGGNVAGQYLWKVGGGFIVDNGGAGDVGALDAGNIGAGGGTGKLAVEFTGNSQFTLNGIALGNPTNINYVVDSSASLAVNSQIAVGGLTNTFIVNGTLICPGGSTNIISGTGTFTLASGATLETAAAAGITSSGATGSIQTTTRSFSSGATYIYNGTVAQVTGNALAGTAPSAGHVAGLTINNALGLTLSASVTANTALTLTSGVITGSGNTLGLGTSAMVTGASQSSYVYGSVNRAFNTGSGQSFSFPVGSSSTYSPVQLTGLNVGTAGSLSATATANTQPNLATSGINNVKYAKRYWTVAPPTSDPFALTGGSSYNAVVTYVAGDLQGSANQANFIMQKYDATHGWLAPTGSTVNSGSGPYTTEGDGFSSFSDIAVGEGAAPSISSNPANVTVCSSSPAATFTVVASGAALTYEWQISTDGGTTWADVTVGSGIGTASYTTNAVLAASGNKFQCIVSGSYSPAATSTAATLTVNASPAAFTITGGGHYCAGGAGADIGLSGSASGVNYQLKNGASNVGSPVAGNGSALDFNSQPAAGTYTVVATDATSGCTTAMTGSVTVTIDTAPAITTEPLSQTNTAADTAEFTVAATGTGLSYQWYTNGVSLANTTGHYGGVTGTTLYVTNVSSADVLDTNTGYYCVVSGTCGTTNTTTNALVVTSAAAYIQVETAADGSGTVVGAQNVTAGSSITVYAVARGSGGAYLLNDPADTWTLTSKSGGVVDGDLVASGDGKSAVFTAHKSGTAVIHVADTGLPTATSVDSGTITAVAGAVSASVSTVTSSPGSVTADGSAASTITVTLYDAGSNPVSGKTVTLASSRGATDSISAASGTSDSNGHVTFTVTSTTAGSAVFTATDTGDSVTVAQTAGVSFTAGAVSASVSTVSPSSGSVTANGTSTSTITVTLTDAHGNPVSGKTVTLAQTSGAGTPTITTVSGTTSVSGVATFTVKSTTAATDVFTATDVTDSSLAITQTASVTFTAGAVSASTSTVSASPTSVTANGSTTSTVTITLKDANSNPVSGKTVTLVKSSGSGTPTVTPVQGTTDASGVATYTVSSTTAAADVFTAADSTDTITVTQTATVTFTPGAIDHYTVTAGATQKAGKAFTVTVTAKDANGNTVTSDSSTVVTMTASSGTVVFDSNGDGTFGDNTKTLTAGTFTISTKDPAVESVTITATDGNSKTGTSSSLSINAAVLTWDGGKTGTGASDTAGSWDTTSTVWYDATVPGDVVWDNSSSASFGAGGTAVTVSMKTTVTVNNVTFNQETSGGYLVTGSSFTLTFTGGTNKVDNTTAATVYKGIALAGSVGFTKTGNGTLVFSSMPVPTFTGALHVAAGTLQMLGSDWVYSPADLQVDSGATFDLGGKNATVGALIGGGTINNTVTSARTLTTGNSDSGEFDGVIESTGAAADLLLVKTGAGTETLGGASTYTGATTVSAGKLLVNGSLAATAVSVSSGATFGGTGTAGGTVNYASGALAAFTQGSPMTISGTLTLNTTVVHVTIPSGNSPLGAGTYPLANYSGTLSGTANTTPVIDSGSIASGNTASIAIDTSGKHINLVVACVGPTATVSGGGTICSGGSTSVAAALTGTGPWNVTWSDGTTDTGVSASPDTRTVSPSTTTTYTVTALTDASGCGSAATTGGSALVTVNHPATATVRSADSTTVCPSTSATIHADLTGVGPWSVTWSDGTTHASVSTSPDSLTVTPGSTTVYTVTAVSGASCGTGTAGGSATVTVSAGGVTVNSGPASLAGSVGETASFTVNATVGNPTYQWQTNNGSGFVTDTSAANTATYTIPNVTVAADNNLQVQCIITSGCDASTATAGPATLTVVPGDYKTGGSGLWTNAAAVWLVNRHDGNGYVTAQIYPTAANATNIVIQGGNNVTNATAIAAGVSDLNINAGGLLVVSNVTLTINHDATTGLTYDANISGTLTVFTNVTSVVAEGTGATVKFQGGSAFNLLAVGGTIPAATWDASSTCTYAPPAAGSTVPGGLTGQAFGNFVWNWPNQSGSANLAGALTTVNGNLEVTANSTFDLTTSGDSSTYTLTVGGAIKIHGGAGKFAVAGGSPTGTYLIKVGAGLILDATAAPNSSIDWGNSGTHPGDTLEFTGNGQFTLGSFATVANPAYVSYKVDSTATVALNSPIAASKTFEVAGTLNCGASQITGAGSFTLDSGATLGIGDVNGITASGATGNIQTTTRSFSTGASYVYGGTSSQVLGSGLPTTVNNLTLAGGMTNSFTVINAPGTDSPIYHVGGTLTANSAVIAYTVSGSTLHRGTYPVFTYGTLSGSFGTPSLVSGTETLTPTLSTGGNQVALVVANTAPVANADSITRNSGVSAKAMFTNLLANDTDVDGDTLTVSGVDSATAGGKSLALNSTNLASSTFVIVPDNAADGDTFHYTISDGQGGTASATVTIHVASATGQGQTVTVTGSSATVSFSGIPGYSYELQRSTNLTDWVTLETTNAPAAGAFQYSDGFSDLGGVPGQAYYRLLVP